FYRTILIPQFGYRVLNINEKPVLRADNLLTILIFNITYNINIFLLER
ncbi:FluG domain-containing protein, partial [Colletotrichum lupini]